MKIFRLIILLTILVSVSISCYAFQGKVVKVTDGDTITVLNIDNQQVKIRLWGIDAPESKQAYGTRSKQYLSKLVFGVVVDVVDLGKDVYGRTIGKVYLDDQYINLMMIQAGLAWHYKRYSPRDTDLSKAESLAKQQQLGLWADKNPTPPWQFRADKKAKK